jgi:Short C-terminal domain
VAQQEPIRVVVEKKGGCFSGCGSALALLFLIAIAIKFWYVSLGLIVLAVAIGVIAAGQEREKRRKAEEAARRKPGPRDPWLNEVAVALGELGLTEVARNTGQQLGGAPMEGDIGLKENRLLVYVNLFANPELARQAEIGLRAQPNVKNAIANGKTTLKPTGPLLLVAHGQGGVVDEFRMNEVEHALAEVPLPPAFKAPSGPAPRPLQSISPKIPPAAGTEGDPLEQIRKLAKLRDDGVLSEADFEAKKAELLRRV